MSIRIDLIKEQVKRHNLKVIADMHVSDDVYQKRTWKERLFTRPWTPFVKDKVIYSPKAYLFGNTILVSYQTYSILSNEGIV